MRYKNHGEAQKVRLDEPGSNSGYKWVTVRTGELIDLPEGLGEKYGFVPEEIIEKPEPQAQATDQTDEPNADENPSDDYAKRLQKIKGIGKKTAQDILEVFPTLEKLQNAIKEKKELPFRDDVVSKLTKEFA